MHTRFSIRRQSCPILPAVIAGAVMALASAFPAHAQDTVPAEAAIKRLEAHRAIIAHRRDEMSILYGNPGGVTEDQPSAATTLRSAFKDRVSQATTDLYARAWAGAGLAHDYGVVRQSVYNVHDGILAESIGAVRERGSATAGELAAIDEGMGIWTVSELGVQKMLSDRVGLLAEAGGVEDMKRVASALSCRGDPACEQQRRALDAAAKAAGDRNNLRLEENRKLIAGRR